MCVCQCIFRAASGSKFSRTLSSQPARQEEEQEHEQEPPPQSQSQGQASLLPASTSYFFSLASPLHFFFGSFPAFRSFRFTNYWKNTIFRDFPIFLRSWIFFSYLFFLFILYFSSLILPISAFHLSIFSEIFNF